MVQPTLNMRERERERFYYRRWISNMTSDTENITFHVPMTLSMLKNTLQINVTIENATCDCESNVCKYWVCERET